MATEYEIGRRDGMLAVVRFLAPFDQNLPGFDRHTCQRLIVGVKKFAEAYEARVLPGSPPE